MVDAQEQSISDSLEVARAHLGISSGDIDLPDLIAHADIEFNWNEFKKGLVERISTGNYGRSQPSIVDLPKNSLTVRPLVRMEPEDRLIYDAAIFSAADLIESATPRGVYSYRWWKARKVLLGSGMWIKMQRSARYLHEKRPKMLLARTDVSAFYENIEANILMDDFRGVGAPAWSSAVLDQYLASFNGKTGVWGIPQGSDASGLLANLYLFTVDEEITRRGLRHYRYSDDMYIFGEDWIALREALLEATKILRYRHLTLSGAKTRIYRSVEIPDVFESDQKDAISYGVQSLDVESIEDLHKLFDKTTDAEKLNERDLKYCLSQLGYIHDDYAAAWIIANIDNTPHVTREALIYLGKFPWLAGYIEKSVLDLLTNSKLKMYPYAEHHLLIYMINHDIRSKGALRAAWDLLLDKNKASFVREFAARYIGLASPPGSALRLKQQFHLEDDDRIRRALLVACYESGQCGDDWLVEILLDSKPILRRTAQYLMSDPEWIPRPAIERIF